MRHRLLVALGALLLAAPMLLAIPAPAGAESSGSPMCKSLGQLGKLDARYSNVLASSSSWQDSLDALNQLTPKLNKAWKSVIKRVPAKQKADAKLVAGFTKRVLSKIGDTKSQQDAAQIILQDPDALSAGRASQRLESFSQAKCGVSINNE